MKEKIKSKKPIITRKKVIKVRAVDAIALETEFIKGIEQKYSLAYNPKTKKYDSNIEKAKEEHILFENISWKLIPKEYRQYLTRKQKGRVLTAKGRDQKANCYKIITGKGGRRYKVSKILEITDQYVIDNNLLPKDEQGNRPARHSTRIDPPKVNTTKQMARAQTKLHILKTKKTESIRKEASNRKKRKSKSIRNKYLNILKFIESLGIKTTRLKTTEEIKEKHQNMLKKKRIAKNNLSMEVKAARRERVIRINKIINYYIYTRGLSAYKKRKKEWLEKTQK